MATSATKNKKQKNIKKPVKPKKGISIKNQKKKEMLKSTVDKTVKAKKLKEKMVPPPTKKQKEKEKPAKIKKTNDIRTKKKKETLKSTKGKAEKLELKNIRYKL